jgi:hypothetical protein
MGMSFLQLVYVTAASLCAISPVSAADFGNVKGSQGQPSFNPSTYPGIGGTTRGAGANTNAGTGAPIGAATLSIGTATDSGPARSGGSQSTPTVAPPGGQSIANGDITVCETAKQTFPQELHIDCSIPPASTDVRGNGGSSSSGGDLVDAAVFDVH